MKWHKTANKKKLTTETNALLRICFLFFYFLCNSYLSEFYLSQSYVSCQYGSTGMLQQVVINRHSTGTKIVGEVCD